MPPAKKSLPTPQLITGCELKVTGTAWPFAGEKAREIDTHWGRRSRENAAFFNGRIHLLHASALEAGVFKGQLLRTDFKSYLYWRETGFADVSVQDAFGSALLRSSEGYVLLGRQREGHINSGLAYLPGGFIDDRDVGPDGRVDIDGSIRREVAEETGLDVGTAQRRPGYWLTRAGVLVSFAAEFRFQDPAEALLAHIEAHLAEDAESELTEVVLVRSAADLDGLAVPDYARALVCHVLQDP